MPISSRILVTTDDQTDDGEQTDRTGQQGKGGSMKREAETARREKGGQD
jgi:hypothetical protein